MLVDKGRAVPFDGDLDDYAKWFTTREAAETAEEPSSTALSAEQKKQRKREEAERRNRLSPLKAEIAKLEKQLERLEKERAGSGALGDIGAHIVDLTQYITGERITRVTAEPEVTLSDAVAAADEDGGRVRLYGDHT